MDEKPRTVGEFIRARRKLLDNMSQDELAALVDRDQTFISQMERNTTDGYLPPRDMLYKLTEALHCSISDLLAAAGYMDEPIHPDIRPRAMMWAQKTDNFTPKESVLVDMFLEQIRRNKGDEDD